MSKKICTDCNIRPVGSGRTNNYEDRDYCVQQDLCMACGVEGQMSNSHHNGHESIPEAECWFCHPELDWSKENYVPRVGTSRAGMEITVPIRAAGQTKAIVIGARLSGVEIEAGTTEGAAIKALRSAGISIVTRKGVTTLKTGDAKLVWDARGRFDYDASSLGEKKMRNAAAYLRALSA